VIPIFVIGAAVFAVDDLIADFDAFDLHDNALRSLSLPGPSATTVATLPVFFSLVRTIEPTLLLARELSRSSK
jgi:hypothetical protein